MKIGNKSVSLLMKGHVGTHYCNADELSRRPCSKCKFDPSWEKDSSDRLKGVYINQVHGAHRSEEMTERNRNENDLPLSDLQRKDIDISLIKT
jgi:hypothetical protein